MLNKYYKIFFVLIILGCIFSFAKSASAATYYVRADGTVTAANKANATSPNAVGTSLNMAQVKLATFVAGDQVLFSSQGGDYTAVLTLPSGGSDVGSEITYANVPSEIPIISVASDPVISTNSKSNIKVIGFSVVYSGTNDYANGIAVVGNGSSNITINSNTINMGSKGYGIVSGANTLSGVFMDHNTISNVRPANQSLYFYGTGLSNFTLTNHTVTENSIGTSLKNINGLTINGFNASGGITNTIMLYIKSCSGVVSIDNLTTNITTGAALSLDSCNFGAGSSISNLTSTNATAGGAVTVVGSTGSLAMVSGINVTGSAIYSISFLNSAMTTTTLSAVISNASNVGFSFNNSSGVVVQNSSYSGTGSSGYRVSNGSTNISFVSDTSNGLGSGGGFYEEDSSNISYTDCTATNGKGFTATTNTGSSSNISYLRCDAGSQSQPNTTSGFIASGAVTGVTYTNSNADYNANLGFVAQNSANDIVYRYCKSSYNGTVDVNTDGGGFLPHNTATNVRVYNSIAHHNYNEGFGDVSNGDNHVYNSVNWGNGFVVGDTFNGVVVSSPAVRGNLYFSSIGSSATLRNIISGGGGKPREIQQWGTTYPTTLDYNLYKPLDDNKFISYDEVNNTSWATYHNTNETHSRNADPLFINGSGNYSTDTDFQLSYLSPAIDAGTNVGLNTDYTGTSHIYGTPDIGAYEYQPPYTISTDLVDPTGSIRIYSDGKYRYTTATSNTQSANFSVSPVGGWPSSDYSEYMNVTLDSWSTSGTKNKQWTATSSIATNTIYTIGNLAPSKYYQFKLDEVASTTAIAGDTCTNGLCLSDSSGNLTFTYTGGYSTHTFSLEQNTGAPTNVGILSISADSTTQLTITFQIATDADPGLHSAPYWFNETTGHSGGSSSSDWQTLTSFVNSGLSANTQYTYQVKARDNNLNESAYSDSLSKYTLAPIPTNLSASSNSNSVSLSVDSFPNDTSGTSGYYFSRSGANSGWIQTNSWTDSGLSCGHSYDYSVIYRNGDGTETSSISTTKSTSGCGGGGSPAMWTLPVVPTNGFKMSINGGATTTSNRNVILGFNAGADIKKMAISMTGDFTDASQENYVASKQWDLCSKLGGAVKNSTCPNGIYKVYVKFFTAYGRTTGNAFASSTIILKSSPTPTENLQQTNNLTFTNSFTKYLQYRQTNADIKRLQIFLNSDPDTQIAVSGAGSPGKETNYFGLLTLKAVIKFQEKYAKDVLAPWGFVKGTGYVGKTTLLKINELIGK